MRLEQHIGKNVLTADSVNQNNQAKSKTEKCAGCRSQDKGPDNNRHQDNTERSRANLDASQEALQDDDDCQQNCQLYHACDVFVFHKNPPCCPSDLSDGMHKYIYSGFTATDQSSSSGTGPKSSSKSSKSICVPCPERMACHCSLVSRMALGLLPWKGPTMPFSSISSTIRAARA